MKKYAGKFITIMFALSILLSMTFHVDTRAAKTKKHTMTVLQNDTLSYDTGAGSPTGLKVKNKKICTAKSISTDSKVFIKGKKKGKTYVTFKDGNIHYKIKVKVLSLKETKAKAKKKIKTKMASLKKGTRYIYKDLDKDGIKELILEDNIYYYNYRLGKLKTRKNRYKDFYVGKGTTFYGVLKKPRYTSYTTQTDEAITPSNAEFAELGEFAGFDDHHIFKYVTRGMGYRKYTKLGRLVYGQKKDYGYYDHGYDQDDYQYVSFTKDEMKQRIKSRLKSGKRLTWKVK